MADPGCGFVIYPYLKRFTWLCHPASGRRRAGAGGRLDRGDRQVDWQPFLLGGGGRLWIGGFDIIYATMDLELDRREGLHSIPRRFGIGGRSSSRGSPTLARSRCSAGSARPRARARYWLGVAVVAVLLAYENSIVQADDLSRVDIAFLTMNGVISMVYLAGVLADVLV